MIFTREWFRATAAAIFFSILSACGGGGGGGGGGSSPAPTPADEPNAYFPTSSTLSWDYTSNAGPAPVSLSFAADRISDGLHIHALQFPTGGKEYYVTSASQIKLKGLFLPQILVNGGSYTGDISFSTAEVIWDSTLPDGQTRNVSGSGKVDISPTYGDRSMTYSGTVTAGVNGTFTGSNGIQPLVRIAINLTMSATIEGVTFTIPYNATIWIAEGIGIVIRTQDSLTYTLADISGPDRDGDGVADVLDKFPDDATESQDFDNDGIGNNADTDDDNDGVADNSDAFPLNTNEFADFDHDGVGDNTDTDDDNDGVPDNTDAYPHDASKWAQSVLYPSDEGIALTALPSANRLSQTVTILDSNELTGATWTAIANQPWLTVTPSGTTNGQLTVTANPGGLTQDTVHYATVTITPSSGNVASTPASIRVGLWVGNSNPTASGVAIPWDSAEVTTDPVSPYVYVHRRFTSSSQLGGTIYVYNIYTQSLVNTITTSASALGSMQISGDGRYLFLADLSNYTQQGRIIRVDLTNTANPVTIDLTQPSTRMAYSRPNGHGVLILENGHILDAATGLQFTDTFSGIGSANSLSSSTDGRKFCSSDFNDNNPRLACFRLTYFSTNGGSGVRATSITTDPIALQTRGIYTALSADGGYFYSAQNAVFQTLPVAVYTTTTLSEIGGALPNNAYTNKVVVGSDNAIYGINSQEVWSYNADFSPRAINPIAETIYFFDVSGDSLMITYVTSAQLRFMTNY